MTAARRWLRLPVDWDEADWMVTLSPGARLAWLKLLCEARIMGFGGRLRIRPARAYAIPWCVAERDVAAMLKAAIDGGALLVLDREWRVSDWKSYLPPRPSAPNRWKVLRLEILERDGWICRYCGSAANHVDHVVSRKRGGTDDPSNLVAACGFCNRSKLDRDLGDRSRSRRGLTHA